MEVDDSIRVAVFRAQAQFARVGRHGGRPSIRLRPRQPCDFFLLTYPSAFPLSSGGSLSRTAGEAEAEVEAPISCIVGVSDF
jgi:hypothetical protein